MNTIGYAPAASWNEVGDDDDIIHTACEHDTCWSLCGMDVSDDPWSDSLDDDDPDQCRTCDDFDIQGFCAHCAMGGQP